MKIENEEELKRQIQDCVFPVHITENLKFSNRGLTKREYFAAMALIGYISQNDLQYKDDIAEYSVLQADELIKALNK